MGNDKPGGDGKFLIYFPVGIYIGLINVATFISVPLDLHYGHYPTRDNVRKDSRSDLGGESLFGKINYVISTPGRELSMLLFYDESKVDKKF